MAPAVNHPSVGAQLFSKHLAYSTARQHAAQQNSAIQPTEKAEAQIRVCCMKFLGTRQIHPVPSL
jgi:hypothetical protein